MMLQRHYTGAMSNLSSSVPPGFVETQSQIANTQAKPEQARVPAWLLLLIGGYIIYRLMKK